MPRTKVKNTKPAQKPEIIEDLIRERAYLKWLTETNGTPVSETDTVRFWVEAEEEMVQEVNKELE